MGLDGGVVYFDCKKGEDWIRILLWLDWIGLTSGEGRLDRSDVR